MRNSWMNFKIQSSEINWTFQGVPSSLIFHSLWIINFDSYTKQGRRKEGDDSWDWQQRKLNPPHTLFYIYIFKTIQKNLLKTLNITYNDTSITSNKCVLTFFTSAHTAEFSQIHPQNLNVRSQTWKSLHHFFNVIRSLTAMTVRLTLTFERNAFVVAHCTEYWLITINLPLFKIYVT